MRLDEFNFLVMDRVQKIRQIINKYGEENFYISFSGGKDSCCLSALIDEALPNNKIPRVYFNTGIEYAMVVDFVKAREREDNRIQIINSGVNIRKMLEENGYPFKSKDHSEKLYLYQSEIGRGDSISHSVKCYVDGVMRNDTSLNATSFICPNCLKHQFCPQYELKVSSKCCDTLKKNVSKNYIKKTGKYIVITGERTSEGGSRSIHKDCIVFQKNEKPKKFKPLNPVSNEFVEMYIKDRNIQLCELYYPPYNFNRTGCKGCPYAINLQGELDVMKRLLPNEYKQCEIIWKPVYDEYRRIGYRLRPKDNHKKLF